MKKTLLFISILLALFIALTGCSGTPESDKAETPVTPVTPAPNPDTPPIGGTSTGPTSPFSVGQSAVWVNMTVTLNDGITFRKSKERRMSHHGSKGFLRESKPGLIQDIQKAQTRKRRRRQ